jgi:predicted kinase
MIKLIDILFENFILEYSKNDPIPELDRIKTKLAVFVFGPPASGKSTLIKNFIMSRAQFKVINTDNISAIRKKIPGISSKLHDKDVNLSDPNLYVPGTSTVARNYIKSIFNSSDQNVIYDTTGNDYENVISLTNLAKDNGYTVIFIHVLAPVVQGIKGNNQRDRHVNQEFLKKSYEKSQSLMKYFAMAKPDNYYVITQLAGQYKFYKYENGKLLRNKNGKYE